MGARRKTAKRKGITQKRQSSVDLGLSCPVLATIAASRPSATTRTTDSSKEASADPREPPQASDWRDNSAQFVASLKGMTRATLLACLEEAGVPAARELRQGQRELEEARHMQTASRAALKDAAVFGRTNEGRQTFQTILTAHAYDVDEGPSTLPDYRKAEILGVHPAAFSAARQRAKSLQPALPPAAALRAGAYRHRSRRSRRERKAQPRDKS